MKPITVPLSDLEQGELETLKKYFKVRLLIEMTEKEDDDADKDT